MRTRLSLSLLLFGLLAFLAVGCGSDDDDNGNPAGPGSGGSSQIDLSSAQVTIPTAMQNAASASNPGAAQAVALLTLANSISTYSTWWTPPAPKLTLPTNALGADTIISWSQGSLEIILELNTAGTATTFAVTLNGSDGQDTYEGFIYIDGYVLLDGSEGNVSINDANDPGFALIFWQWGTDPDGIFNLSVTTADDDGLLTVTQNPDGSGSVSQTLGSVASFEATWATNGAGSYIIYDGSGNPQDTGTW